MPENIINDAIAFVKEIFKNRFDGHDAYHALRVYNMATNLATHEHADVEIVQLAALLHDVDDYKISPDTYGDKMRARTFLDIHNVNPEIRDKIIHIIDQVGFKMDETVKPDSLEGQCVQDADYLDTMGAIGVARCFAYGGAHNRPLHEPDTRPDLYMDGKTYMATTSTAINHFYEKLLRLKDLISTPSGKIIAEERHNFMAQFLAEFLTEWSP